MKSIFKKIGFGLIGILLLLAGYSFINYAPDKTLEELKKTWAYDNSQFLEMDGMSVHYRINGEGAPIVLVHGTAASLHTWEEWTKVLEKEFKVISLDLPAFGLTGPNPERIYNLEFYASFLDKFLGKLGIEKFSLAGNSLGGAIGWKYATLFPQKLNSIILIDPAGYPRNRKSPLAFRLAQNKIASKFLLSITPKSLFKKSILDVYHNDELVTDELIQRYYELYLRAGNRQAFVDRVNAIKESEHSIIASVNTPTLIMWGKEDAWIPVEDATKFKNDIKNSEMIIYENLGHVPMEEAPLKTVKDAKAFFLKNTPKEFEEKIGTEEELTKVDF